MKLDVNTPDVTALDATSVFFFFTQHWKRKKKREAGGFAERTLYGELGLCFDGGVGVAGRAGVDAAVLLCQVGDLEASSSHELQAAHAGSTERQSLRGTKKKEKKEKKYKNWYKV